MKGQISQEINTIADSLQLLQDLCKRVQKGEADPKKELPTIEKILGERVGDLRKLAKGWK
jgi:hypothetical protein